MERAKTFETELVRSETVREATAWKKLKHCEADLNEYKELQRHWRIYIFMNPPGDDPVLPVFAHTSGASTTGTHTMRFSTTALAYLASALLSVLAPQAAQAGITAFSGSSCDGDVGLNVPCDGSCHKFDERHSFRVRPFPLPTDRAILEGHFTDGGHVQVDSGTGDHCVTVFEGPGCPLGGPGFFLPHQTGQCQNVNTGTNVRSFTCSQDSTCLQLG